MTTPYYHLPRTDNLKFLVDLKRKRKNSRESNSVPSILIFNKVCLSSFISFLPQKLNKLTSQFKKEMTKSSTFLQLIINVIFVFASDMSNARNLFYCSSSFFYKIAVICWQYYPIYSFIPHFVKCSLYLWKWRNVFLHIRCG